VSSVVDDTVGVDLTAPSISSLVVNAGAGYTGTLAVSISIVASDSGGSGLAEMHFRSTGETSFSVWVPYATSHALSLRSGDGPKIVEAQVLDGAGNTSSVSFDQIVLDQTGPSVTSFAVNGGRPYVAPGEPVTIVLTASDAGSGLESFAATYDNGGSWTPWVACGPGAVTVGSPVVSGLLPVRVRVRDALGSLSTMSSATMVHFIEGNPPFLGSSGAFSGGISARTDIDAVGIDLAAGDVLAVKMKAAGAEKSAGFSLVLDLVGPGGTRPFTGVTSIAGYAAADTGRHLIVLRLNGDAGSSAGTYSFSAKVKLGAANAKGKGSYTGQFTFAASEGGLFKASLKGPGLDAGSVVVEGPEGLVAALVSGGTGSAKLTATLSQGTGTYTVRYAATGPVAASWSVKLPKGPTLVEP
jgi:hypothetical protein